MLAQLAQRLTALRTKAAQEFQKDMESALQDMNFLHVEFQVSLTQKDSFGAEGKDEVVFLISTNPGEPVKPLAAIASGGELSRIMLALKTITAKQEKIGTFILMKLMPESAERPPGRFRKTGNFRQNAPDYLHHASAADRGDGGSSFYIEKMQPTILRRRRSQSCPRQTA